MIDLHLGDCLEVMKQIPNKSVDAIICDLPYGTTACKWDSVIPFEPLWEQYKQVIKDSGAIVLFGSQPFTSSLITSNLKWFKYCWYWEKSRPTGHLNAKKMPMKNIEEIIVFYNKQCTYNPQMTIGNPNHVSNGKVRKTVATNNCYGKFHNVPQKHTNLKYPKQLQKFHQQDPNKILHPTQKPVALMEYLVKTYTNQGDTVLDNCMGSGTTGVACKNLNRKFIGIERDANYFEIAKRRING